MEHVNNAIDRVEEAVKAMPSHLQMVAEFHALYGQPVETTPTISDHERRQLRYNLIREELDELYDALKNRDLVGVADALVDLEYVVLGGYLEFGLGELHSELFAEVQRSNLTKLDENGKPVYNLAGKVIKGPNYSPPRLREILGL